MDDSSYDAFLSYSSRDRVRVLRLQRELEQISQISSKPWHVFVDHTDMAARGIWADLEAALARSKAFILCASPAAARSRYVADELQRFRSSDSNREVFVALIDGDESCIPDSLAGIKYADLRRALSRWPVPAKRDELLRLAAALLSVPVRDLIPWAARRRRRVVAQAAAVVGIPLALAAAAYAVQREQLKASEAQALVDEAFSIQEQGDDPGQALDRLFKAEQKVRNSRLHHAMRYLNSKLRTFEQIASAEQFLSTPDGTYQFEKAPSSAPIRIASFVAEKVLSLGDAGLLAFSARDDLACWWAAGQAAQESVLTDFRNTAAISEHPNACLLNEGWIRVTVPTGEDEQLVWVDSRKRRLSAQLLRPDLKDEPCGQEWTDVSFPKALPDTWVELFESDDTTTNREPAMSLQAPQAVWEEWRGHEALRTDRLGPLADAPLAQAQAPRALASAVAQPQKLRERVSGDDEVIRLRCGTKSFIGILSPQRDQFSLQASLDTAIAPLENNVIAIGNARLGSPAVVAPDCSQIYDFVNQTVVSSRRQGARQRLGTTLIEGHPRQAAFSPNSTHLVTASADGFVRSCQRRLNIEPPCRSNIEPGRVAGF